jgi:uncharacterized SAM-binding protein YcdF (DUF218 family)
MKRLARWTGMAPLPLGGVAGGFAWFLATAAAEPSDLRRTDAIVVLTGGAERVETGLDLLDAGLAPRLLVSGADARATLGELARAHGRDPAALAGRVSLGRAAATTMGNAAETAAWVRTHEVASLRVVTAGYHMPRAELELRRAMPAVELVPHPVGPAGLRDGDVAPLRAARLLAGEYVKYGLALTGLSALAPARDSARR